MGFAQKLLEGTYHDEEDEQEDNAVGPNENPQVAEASHLKTMTEFINELR